MDLSDRATRMRVNKRFRERGIPAKVCGKCFVVKGHAAFYTDSKAADGRRANCRECFAETSRRWYAQNRDRKAESDRQWYAQNRDRKAETDRQWRAQNPDYFRQWYEANRDHKVEHARQWRAQNPDKVRMADQRRKAAAKNVPTEPFTASDLRHDWEDHDLWSCFFCGGSLTDAFDIEHFYPKFPDDEETTPAGPHAVWNLVPSCPACNRGRDGKHSKEPWQFLRESLAEQGIDLDACLEFLAGRRR
ncbi:hypothetical protein ABZ722_33985 [Streptomyces longwoodensis]|uniref:hypothetical protein n=1 Tax=Streptomyces longwoodensis TaxID=68231 RepID=UPI0033CC5EED